MRKKVLISLHDVTPVHWERIQKAEQNVKRWGIEKLNYLLIPDYHYHSTHHRSDAGLEKEFDQWLQEKQGSQFQWILHGYYHLERPPENSDGDDDKKENEKNAAGSLSNQFKRKYLTAGEGEFLELAPAEIRNRIKKGCEVFRQQTQHSPDMFIAPAWLYNCHLYPVLREYGIRTTEDHSGIHFLDTNSENEKTRFQPAPVITWATRTLLRKFTSQIGCPQLNRLYSNKSLIRVAMHPFDFDHPGTVRSIEKVIKSVIKNRTPHLYRDLHR
jgi:uncharacterized protein